MTLNQLDAENEVRIIEAVAPPTRFARGWHCLGLLDGFRDGKPHGMQAFGTKLVVFADSTGKLNVLNGYCPHMGGDLSQGSVKGDDIACPFHDWRWAGNGRCTDIPYAKRVPPRARTRAWTTLERNGQLFVWHDPQGNPPPPEVTIPEIPGIDTSEWTSWRWNSILIEGSHTREIVDNVVDMAHFFYVHYASPLYFKNVFEGHIAAQYSKSKPRKDADFVYGYDAPVGNAEAIYYGPAYMIDYEKMTTDVGETVSALINCHYPVTPTSFVLQYGVSVRKIAGLDDDKAEEMASTFAGFLEKGFLQDVEIWKNKAKIDNPLLSDQDGPVYQLRRWYEQFFVDVEDVTPEMTQRFEFEIDTERANASWQKEIDENLAAGRVVDTSPKRAFSAAALAEPAGSGQA